MEKRLLKPGEVDVLFRYPTGRTLRLTRQGKIPFITLPDGEIRIKETYVQQVLRSQDRETESADLIKGPAVE